MTKFDDILKKLELQRLEALQLALGERLKGIVEEIGEEYGRYTDDVLLQRDRVAARLQAGANSAVGIFATAALDLLITHSIAEALAAGESLPEGAEDYLDWLGDELTEEVEGRNNAI